MDPYDAIIEQLKGAQNREMDVLRDRLGEVLETLNRASSSVQEVLAEKAGEVLPTEIETSISQLLGRAGAAAPAGVDLDMIRRLDSARSQSDLLHELLAMLQKHASRAVVLVIRSGNVSAWSGIGFEDGSILQRWQGELGDSHLFQQLVDESKPTAFEPSADPLIVRWIEGSTSPDQALLVPIHLRGKMMGAVYLDRVGAADWNPDAAQALIAVACWMIDTLHHRVSVPSPMIVEVSDYRPEVQPSIEEPEPMPDEAPAAEDFEVAAEVEMAEADYAIPAEAPAGFEAEEPELGDMAAEPGFDPSATVQVDVSEMELSEPEPPAVDFELDDEAVEEPAGSAEPATSFEAMAEPEPVAPPPMGSMPPAVEPSPPAMEPEPPAMEPEPPAMELEPPAMEPEPPAVEPPPPVEAVVPPVEPVEPPPAVDEGLAAMSPEDETRHEEARRFARLLVSEIKLYNEEDVERGRANRDLYQRLKEDVDRSREMYEKRIPPEIRAARDYFQEELVRILADGDPDALGM